MRNRLADPATFERMYDDHHRGVFSAAHRILGNPAQAEDVAQDVFLRLWRKPETFDARRGELGSYLRLMARSRALDLWREGQALGRASDRLKLVVDRNEGRVEDRPAPAVERDGDRATVRAALRALPGAQREAIVLAYWGGLTAGVVLGLLTTALGFLSARRAGIPLGTAKSRIRLGLARLRDECGDLMETGVTALAAA